jgi:DNA-binding GntR family transcriptional regulator
VEKKARRFYTIDRMAETAARPLAAPELGHRTLAAAIAQDLRRAILAAELTAGQPLRQDALAARYAVSRIPVREALFALEAEGLVEMHAHRGAVVATLSPQEVQDIFELRALLEPRLLRRSVPRLTADDWQALDATLAAFDEAVAQGDVARWGQLNAQLHAGLYARAEAPRTEAIVQSLLQSSDRCTRLQMNRPAAWKRAQREHRLLVRRAREGALDEACALLVDHIEQVHRDLVKHLFKPKPVQPNPPLSTPRSP